MAEHGKRLKIAAATSLGRDSVDWSRCCLCQSSNTVNLICPSNNPNAAQRNAGYISLASTLDDLKPFGHVLSSNLPVECLDDGNGVKNTLISKEAKWHKACVLRYSGQKLQSLKRKIQCDEDTTYEDL